MEKNYLYEATIKNEDNEIITKIFSYSQEGLLEEMSKGKWTKAIQQYEEEKSQEQNLPDELDDAKEEDQRDDDLEKMSEEESEVLP